ncbi:hypothetical protein [Klebsiella pneumoniae]|uniref:hypothetical protein n=1 Tax=Klebsiella pneumoniae TaxID=573 RepID=UPI001FAC8AC0|nr:hypothetical protein [Klebsiella pneumoniae]
MTITLQAVNELIHTLESAGDLSIKERKYLDLAKAYQQLAAENLGLKAAFSPKEIPSKAVDAFMDTAVMDHDWNETSEWSWVENETEVIRAVLDALKPETPATDRIYAAAEERGVRQFAAAMAAQHAKCQAGGYFDRQVKVYGKAQELAESYLMQLCVVAK